MFDEYEKGRTPNPDVLCNREIKFDAFLKCAEKLGADYVATGHYCRKETVEGPDGPVHRILAGSDPNKDQSYFLCQLTQEQLSYAMFPIGHLLKPEVRRIAEEQKLATAKRKDSQGICFVGKVDLPVFLQQKLAARRGNIVEIAASWRGYETMRERRASGDLDDLSAPFEYVPEDGVVVGQHNGAQFYTIGQRHGLGVGGKALPLFVIGIDVIRNIVYVGQGNEHPGLMRSALRIKPEEMHWVRPDKVIEVGCEQRYLARIRYRQPLQSATLKVTDQGGYLVFDSPQRSITAGQFAAWYSPDGEVIGSGVIDR
jgi:tRNA-specific 2-thiouridylase